MSLDSVISIDLRQTFSSPSGATRFARVLALFGKALDQARARRRSAETVAILSKFDSTLLDDIGIDKPALGRGELRRVNAPA